MFGRPYKKQNFISEQMAEDAQIVQRDYLFSEWIKSKNRSGLFTPDIQQLQQWKNQHVFVYNEAMEGFPGHHTLVGNSEYLGDAYTIRSNYTMWKKSIGTESFPFVLEGIKGRGINSSPSRIKGQLYSMEPKTIIKLDEHVLNTVQFDRVRVRVMIPHILRYENRSEQKSWGGPVECWMYLGRQSFWEDLLDGGFTYPIVGKTGHNPVFERLSNVFHYSLAEHNDFKTNREDSVS